VLEEKCNRDNNGGNKHDTQDVGRDMMINTGEIYCDMRMGGRELILGRRALRRHLARSQSALYARGC
jgi:hypothetical protein